MKTVFTYGGPNPYNDKATAMIEVKQSEGKRALFTVTYGAQVRNGLTYELAAKEFGECMFHAFACDDILNNDGE